MKALGYQSTLVLVRISILRIILVFMIWVCQAQGASALEASAFHWDFKVTGTGHGAYFPNADSGEQENIIHQNSQE